MTNKTENLTETLAKAIELTCEKISKQSHQIAELGKDTRTGIDIHISFDLSDFDRRMKKPEWRCRMTRQEYEYLQERLSKLLSKSDYYGNKKQVYKEGVLAAKSVLSEVFHRQEKMEDAEA